MRERPNWRAALWLRRNRILGKRKFIWRIVVGRLAFPAAAVVTLARLVTDSFGPRFLLHALGNVVAAVVGGYIAGLVLWDLVVNRGGRRSAEPPEPRPQPTPRHHGP